MATYGPLDIKFLTKVYGNKEIGSAIAKLRLKLTDTKPLLQQIGLIHLLNTRRRFESQTDPKGRVWKYNTKTTQKYKRVGLKAGVNKYGLPGITARTPAVMGPNHRGVWTGQLMESLDTRMSGNTVIVYVKKDIPYARVFQEGAQEGEFGYTGRGSKQIPHPWGTIPSRPFLGTNKKTDQEVLKLLRSYLDITKDQPSWPVGVPRS
jgi:phage gpG-like protein